RLGDVRPFGYVGEGTVPVVVIEKAGGSLKDAGNAIVALADFVVAALKLVPCRVVDEATEKQIEAAVVIVIEPDGTRGPAGSCHSRLRRHIGECAVVVVFVENTFAVSRDEHVRPAIVIEIAHRYAHPEGTARNTCFLCYVRERAVPVVLVQSVTNGL